MTDLRATIMAEQDTIASKMRFGLFSQPAPLAIGDNGAYTNKKRNKGQDGKPITLPSQMLSGTCKSGVGKSAYFQVPESILQNDPYKETFKLDLQYDQKMHTKSTFHENQFKPASGTKTMIKSSYEYIEENPEAKKRNMRDGDGKVKTEPRNFTTNPMTKVKTDLFKQLKHMEDPYDRKQEIQKKQRKVFKSKLPQAVFRSMSHGGKAFGKDLTTFGQDSKAKQVSATYKNRVKTTVNAYPHQTKFRPAIKNFREPIGKFPQYIIPQQIKTEPNVKRTEKQEGKETWKSNSFALSRPTPSITLNPRNILSLKRR